MPKKLPQIKILKQLKLWVVFRKEKLKYKNKQHLFSTIFFLHKQKIHQTSVYEVL